VRSQNIPKQFKMPDNDPARLICELFYDYGLSQKEISRRLGIQGSMAHQTVALALGGPPWATGLYPSHYQGSPEELPQAVQERMEKARNLGAARTRVDRHERPRRVLELAAEGWSRGDIAKKLGISHQRVSQIITGRRSDDKERRPRRGGAAKTMAGGPPG
jgi:DNA-directed RNA polymerase specialized sigma subunit